MAIICDNCNTNVTPTNEDEVRDYEILKLNGIKLCLCTDCFCALTDFATSDDFKKYAAAKLKKLE